MTLLARMESAAEKAMSEGAPPKEVVRRVLDQLKQPSPEVITQGCHALKGKLVARKLEEAEYSSDRHEKARVKMKLRWGAMIKAIKRGM